MHPTTKSLCIVASLATGLALTPDASAVDVHISGSGWGVWVTGLFTATADPMNPDTTNYAYMDGGSGVDMDFFFGLPDGTAVTGSDVTNRMITADIAGEVGDPQLNVNLWGLWVTSPIGSFHVVVNLNNLLDLTDVSVEGVHTYTSDSFFDVFFDIEYADGTTETVARDVTSFSFADVPTPGAAALAGLGGLTVVRRRRS